MSTLLLYIPANLIGALFFLFFYWRRIREDYARDVVFTSGFTVIFLTVFASLMHYLLKLLVLDSYIFTPGESWFWLGLLGFIIGVGVSVNKFKMKFIETLEASGMGALGWIGMIYISHYLLFLSDIYRLYLVLLIIFAFIVYIILEKSYKKFIWYRSGRIGFSGAMVIGLYFLSRAGLAFTQTHMISLVGRLDVVLSGLMAFAMFFSVYHLSASHN